VLYSVDLLLLQCRLMLDMMILRWW